MYIRGTWQIKASILYQLPWLVWVNERGKKIVKHLQPIQHLNWVPKVKVKSIWPTFVTSLIMSLHCYIIQAVCLKYKCKLQNQNCFLSTCRNKFSLLHVRANTYLYVHTHTHTHAYTQSHTDLITSICTINLKNNKQKTHQKNHSNHNIHIHSLLVKLVTHTLLSFFSLSFFQQSFFYTSTK